MKTISTIVLLCTLIISTAFGAVRNATEGKEFYLNFMQNGIKSITDVSLQVRYVVSEACYITAQFGDGTYLDDSVFYEPGTYTRNIADKDKVYTATMTSGSVSSKKYMKITSTKRISVYGINMAHATSDATAVLPVETYGKHYTMISNTNAWNTSYFTIAVIAPKEPAVISIKSATGSSVVTNRTVEPGTVYMYSATGKSTNVTGYTVESDVNVAVFSAVSAAFEVSCGADDVNWEQMLPSNTAGYTYYVWNMSGVGNYDCFDYIQIIGLEDGTEVTWKAGNSSKPYKLRKGGSEKIITPTGRSSSTYKNGSNGVVKLTSNKPFLVGNTLGHAPSIKWISPIEQMIKKAVVSPFVPTGNSVIESHRLHILIPADSEEKMKIKEVRNGVETEVKIEFFTNSTDPDYKIGYKQYAANDDVEIFLENSAGFMAHIAGYGSQESYIFTAAAGAQNLIDPPASKKTHIVTNKHITARIKR
jgi:hypothetical protein